MPKGDNKRNSVRVIGGALRSRQIVFPDSEGLRPTADRIRETLFNWLQDEVAGARCLDLFAGSGALGLEAVSRGAARVDLVENKSRVCAALRENLVKLGIDNAHIHHSDAGSWLDQLDAASAYDIVFLDPPYAGDCLPGICQRLQQRNLLARSAKIYLENARPLLSGELPVQWRELKHKKAGQVYYYLFINTSEQS